MSEANDERGIVMDGALSRLDGALSRLRDAGSRLFDYAEIRIRVRRAARDPETRRWAEEVRASVAELKRTNEQSAVEFVNSYRAAQG
jgi:hypothetical protein